MLRTLSRNPNPETRQNPSPSGPRRSASRVGALKIPFLGVQDSILWRKRLRG